MGFIVEDVVLDNIINLTMWAKCPQYEQALSYEEWLKENISTSLLSCIFNSRKNKRRYKEYLISIEKYNEHVDEFFSVEREYNADKTMYKVAIFDSVETVPVVLGNIEDVLIVEESEDY